MAYVYRYIDLADEIVKYVGIAWKGTVEQRVLAHSKEDKFLDSNWKIEILNIDISNRTDAEYIESHFISKYKTFKYLNTAKNNWGESKFLNIKENWKLYGLKFTKDKQLHNFIKRLSDEYRKREKELKINFGVSSIEEYIEDIYRYLEGGVNGF